MLEPRTYPGLIGKALVLEPAAFIEMVEDDEPVAEGLFFTVVLGALIGVAQFIGGLLFSASMPPASAVQPVALQAANSLFGAAGFSADSLIRQWWSLYTLFGGYDTGWLRLFNLVWEPFFLLTQWLTVGLIAHGVAKSQGGSGTMAQTLGATALIAAPSSLLLLTIVPFVSVSAVLLWVWSILIAYRAIQVAHELSWRRAAVTAVIPFAALMVLASIVGFVVSLILTL
jgi:hypothetical protein